jgi:hypothetical protein
MKSLLFLLLALIPAAAAAQSPNPAQLGITSTATPEVLQVLDHTGGWVPIGSVSGGSFTPVGGLSGGGGVTSSPIGSIATYGGTQTIIGIVPGAGIVPSLGLALNGSGAFAGTTSPSLITPNLGTPSAVNLLHATNMPVAGLAGIVPIASGGTGVATLPTGPLFGAGTGPITTGTISVSAGGTGATTLANGMPLFGAGSSPITAGTLSGNTTKLATVGPVGFVSGHMVVADANSNLVDGGVAPSGSYLPLSGGTLTGSLSVTGAITPSSTGGIVGVTDGSIAAAGTIGQVVSASKNLAGATSVANNTNAIVVQLTSLPAGAWQCSGNVQGSPNSSTSINAIEGWISTTTPVGGSGPTGGAELAGTFNLTQSGINSVDGGNATGVVYFNFATPTTVYLGAHFLLGAGTSLPVYGRIDCLRIR